MAKTPKPKTRTIRIYEGLAELVQEVAGIANSDAAQVVEPILRPALSKMKLELLERKLKVARHEVEEATAKAKKS